MCARSPSEVMGGFVAITFDNPELATKSDLGARLFSRISSMPTRTAVYAYRPERIRSATSFQARQAARRADNVAEQGPKKRSAATLPSAQKPTVAP